MKLCFDARMAGHSGIGTYIRNLLPFLDKSFDLTVISSTDCLTRFPELAKYKIIQTETALYSFNEHFTFRRIVPMVDLFWTPHFNVPFFQVNARKRAVTVHDVFFLAHPEHTNFYKRFYCRFFFSKACSSSDVIFTVSDFSKSEINKYIKGHTDKIHAIHLGSSFSCLSHTKKTNEHSYILYVGNLASHKNIINLIKSLDFLPDKLHLVLAGKSTSYQNWMQEYYKRKNRITLVGEISEQKLQEFYVNALALVHPSHYEGFGLTPIEAMQLGCPTIVSNVASLPEVCGDASLYIDPHSPLSIAEAIKDLLVNPRLRESLIIKGKERSRMFSWEKCASDHINAIRKIFP